MKKFIPVIVIASAFLLAFLLGAKAITFDDFISNRDQILMFRGSNLTFSVMIFMLIYISVVTFSIPGATVLSVTCLLYTSPSPRDKRQSRMPSSA